jgi:hypothetical protein
LAEKGEERAGAEIEWLIELLCELQLEINRYLFVKTVSCGSELHLLFRGMG